MQTFVIQQRVAINDLSGYLLQSAENSGSKINHIIFRCWEDTDKDFVLETKDGNITYHREAGYLWYPKSEKMREQRLALYERVKLNRQLWSCQYQQDPNDIALCVIPFTYFNYYSEEVKDLPIYATFITCDIAFSVGEKSDRTCICCWGMSKSGDLYLIDILFDRFDIAQIPDLFTNFYNKNSMRVFVRKEKDNNLKYIQEQVFCFAFYIEKNRNETLIPYFKGKIPCVKPLDRKANATKNIRLNKALPIIGLNCVYLPKKRFFNEINTIREELRNLTFENFNTNEAHDDFCDTLLDAVNEGRQTAYKAIQLLNTLKYDISSNF